MICNPSTRTRSSNRYSLENGSMAILQDCLPTSFSSIIQSLAGYPVMAIGRISRKSPTDRSNAET